MSSNHCSVYHNTARWLVNRQWPVAAVALLVAACTSPDTPAQQLERGAAVYRRECQHCHDVEGAIGVPLTSRVLASFGTARRLFNYVQLSMPYQAPRTLAGGEYWDVVAFLVARHALAPDTIILTPDVAAAVTF